MMRVTTLYAGSAAATARYYTKYLTQAPGEEPRRWTGSQAAGLGLSGEVSKSLLVWRALPGDEGLAECHDVAVRAAIDYLEQFGSTTRNRSNGGRLHPTAKA